VIQLLWDASALTKQYIPERGSDAVQALLDVVSSVNSITTYLCYAETCASLRRRLNDGRIDLADFGAARSALRTEVLLNPDFRLLTATDEDVLAGVVLIDRHNINSTDAAILSAFLGYARAPVSIGSACILVAADRRLLRAAQAEGLQVIDPEQMPAGDVPSFLSSL
jgi:predicted nucleic acid-binding protein